jgi:hypothetical protein
MAMRSLGQGVSRIALLAGLVAAGMFISSAHSARAAGMCSDDWKPVCATANGWQRTYSNLCWAKTNNAKVLYSGTCKWK